MLRVAYVALGYARRGGSGARGDEAQARLFVQMRVRTDAQGCGAKHTPVGGDTLLPNTPAQLHPVIRRTSNQRSLSPKSATYSPRVCSHPGPGWLGHSPSPKSSNLNLAGSATHPAQSQPRDPPTVYSHQKVCWLRVSHSPSPKSATCSPRVYSHGNQETWLSHSPSPKSVMRTWPSLSSSTFSGFRSLLGGARR